MFSYRKYPRTCEQPSRFPSAPAESGQVSFSPDGFAALEHHICAVRPHGPSELFSLTKHDARAHPRGGRCQSFLLRARFPLGGDLFCPFTSGRTLRLSPATTGGAQVFARTCEWSCRYTGMLSLTSSLQACTSPVAPRAQQHVCLWLQPSSWVEGGVFLWL